MNVTAPCPVCGGEIGIWTVLWADSNRIRCRQCSSRLKFSGRKWPLIYYGILTYAFSAFLGFSFAFFLKPAGIAGDILMVVTLFILLIILFGLPSSWYILNTCKLEPVTSGKPSDNPAIGIPTRDTTIITDAGNPKWKTRIVLLVAVVIPASIVGLMVMGLLILRFGNPQWHKSIYLFQAFVCQKGHEGVIPPPSNYTGQWVVWWTTGAKWMEYGVRNGKKHGSYVEWHPNGQKTFEGTCQDGELVGVCTSWYDNGQKSVEKTWLHGKVNGQVTMWDKQGQIIRNERYVDGNIVEHIQENPYP